MKARKAKRDPSGVDTGQLHRTTAGDDRLARHQCSTAIVCLLSFMLLAASAFANDSGNGKYNNPGKSTVSKVRGVVQSGERPLASSTVTLYKAGINRLHADMLGQAKSDKQGFFTIVYKMPSGGNDVLYMIADGASGPSKKPGIQSRKSPVRLATVLGTSPFPGDVVINERTTVATAYAMAQFIEGIVIGGKSPGLQNAAMTLQNLVDITTGQIGSVLGNAINGSSTSTLREFNSLGNLLATCSSSGNPDSCSPLFHLATPPHGSEPKDTLQAIVNIAHNPWKDVPRLFALSLESNVYEPALGPSETPDAWTIAIRYGNPDLFDGPGNIAFDRNGNAWINNNYSNSADPTRVCGDDHVFKLTPAGADFPGSPFGGPGENGGLYGAGFGITLDRRGDVWVSSFGFQGSKCFIGADERTLLSESVSQFDGDGNAVSPSRPPAPYGGWRSTQANIYQPQGTVSDQRGNIWIANCGNASVTKIPRGNPLEAVNFSNVGLSKPFGMAIDAKGNAWIANNGNSSVISLSPDGIPLGPALTGGGINQPMGIATDSLGNVWISNSGALHAPCGGALDSDRLSSEDANAELPPENASVTLRRSDGTLQSFTGGGLFIPWGIVADGNDNIWVANFGG
ncbi:MAG TPA: hypothetical protein VFG28_09050, partial [Syntrophales bacterium]|nr:hypothetical protein [Syntrophales bacterium]